MKIICNFKDAYKFLDRVNDTSWTNDACEEMADEASQIVDAAYATQGYGNTEYEVRTEPTDKGCDVIAEGHDVGFLEFGAGDDVKSDDFDDGSYPVEPGSWSKTHQQVYSRLGIWFYRQGKDALLSGLAPTRGMQLGLDWIVGHSDEVIDRKYNEWINGR